MAQVTYLIVDGGLHLHLLAIYADEISAVTTLSHIRNLAEAGC
jgi:hypothetical protein